MLKAKPHKAQRARSGKESTKDEHARQRRAYTTTGAAGQPPQNQTGSVIPTERQGAVTPRLLEEKRTMSEVQEEAPAP